ncbi:hypothetical protein HNR00_003873 [Methylorubrum rhodinum]|uniref:Uncharacterized protein n=1 Tax=Methylorubrum rhodinum TaxID=29428 RepID=A0A840ZPQ8_9HYPH|nr:hypothetical protein [Methylorubrum rhodinum]MBB5759144.1 hypothetical protein [Methylorubrum rhodinum]
MLAQVDVPALRGDFAQSALAIKEAKEASDAEKKLDKMLEARSAIEVHLRNRQRDRDSVRSSMSASII